VYPGIAPTVYSTRAAIKILKSLVILEKPGAFSITREYDKERDRHLKRIRNLNDFLERCSDKEGAYAGIPLDR